MKHPCTSKHINKISILPNSYFTALVVFKPPSDISAFRAFNAIYSKICTFTADDAYAFLILEHYIRAGISICVLSFAAVMDFLHIVLRYATRGHERVEQNFKIAGKCRMRRFKTSICEKRIVCYYWYTLFMKLHCNSLVLSSISNGWVIYIIIKDSFYAERIILKFYC